MIVIVYGYEGSGPGHWQRWLHAELLKRGSACAFPELSNPLAPLKESWVAELARVVDAAASPVTFAAHSLGCWAVDHYIHEHGTARVQGALLVAPPSPYLLFEAVETFLPPPCNRQSWEPIAERSLFVNSDDDELATAEEIEAIAGQLGVPYQRLAGAGHINTASGYGAWPFALQWLPLTPART